MRFNLLHHGTRATHSNAPITEALIDIRVAHKPGISLERLEEVWGLSSRGVSEREPPGTFCKAKLISVCPILKPSPAGLPSDRSVTLLDRRQAVQARLGGFTFSRFAPYQDRHHPIDEARRLWTIFVAILEPIGALRVALRYVNQINLPLKGGTLNFEYYLRTFPKLEIDGDVLLEQFFLRLVMPQEDLSAQLGPH